MPAQIKQATTLLRISLVVLALGAISVWGTRVSQAAGDESPAKKFGPIAWTDSLARARKTAAKEHKIVFVDFYADWCGPCIAMLRTTYKDKRVVAHSKKFIPVLINVDKQPELAQKYKIETIPALIFMDSKGKVLHQDGGYHDADAFLKLLDTAAK